MIYERRWNKAILGKEKRFANERSKIFIKYLQKYGARFVAGIFQPEFSEDISQVWYIMEYDDLAHREKVYNAIRNDQEYLKQDTEWLSDPCLWQEGVELLRIIAEPDES